MSEKPYTYTDDDGVAFRVGPRVCTAYDRPGRASVGFYTPTGEDAVKVARAFLAVGDTGHEVVSTKDIDAYRARSARGFELTSEVRQLLQQRKDLRKERDAAFEDGARSMQERAAEAALDDPTADYDIRRQILNLPLLPESDTTEPQNGLSEEAQAALDMVRDGRQYPSPRAAKELTRAGLIRWDPRIARYEAVEVAHSGCSQPDNETPSEQPARSDYDAGFADGLRMGDARATDVESRLAALEKLTSDQADALEAQSRLIDQLRTGPQPPKAEDIPTRPYNAWTDG